MDELEIFWLDPLCVYPMDEFHNVLLESDYEYTPRMVVDKIKNLEKPKQWSS